MITPSSLLLVAVVAACGCGGCAGGTPDGGTNPNLDAAPTSPNGQLMFLDNGASKTESVLPTFSRNYLQSSDDFLQVVALRPINGSAGAHGPVPLDVEIGDGASDGCDVGVV